MELVYTGPEIPLGSAIPLPEGWPCCSHEEPDEALAAEKVDSGNYRYAKPPKEAKKEKEGRLA